MYRANIQICHLAKKHIKVKSTKVYLFLWVKGIYSHFYRTVSWVILYKPGKFLFAHVLTNRRTQSIKLVCSIDEA